MIFFWPAGPALQQFYYFDITVRTHGHASQRYLQRRPLRCNNFTISNIIPLWNTSPASASTKMAPKSATKPAGPKYILFLRTRRHPNLQQTGIYGQWSSWSGKGQKVAVFGWVPITGQTQKFVDKYGLKIDLLADPEKDDVRLEAYGPKIFMGKEVTGVYRKAYLIDEKAMFLKWFRMSPQLSRANSSCRRWRLSDLNLDHQKRGWCCIHPL